MAGIFKSKELEKEFKELISEITPSLNDCKNCNILKCHYCTKFSPCCSICRAARCKKCVRYNTSKQILFDNAKMETWEYMANFLSDLFKIWDYSYLFYRDLNLIDEEVKKKSTVFASEKDTTDHFLKNIDYYSKNNGKIFYFFKGRKYWLSGRFRTWWKSCLFSPFFYRWSFFRKKMPTVQELNKKMRSISELLDIVEAISYFIENSDLSGKFKEAVHAWCTNKWSRPLRSCWT